MTEQLFTETDFVKAIKPLVVSRETLDKLNIYHNLLIKWQRTINLVGKSTLNDIWRRHFLDSAQLIKYFPSKAKTIIDFGSGGGFPVLIYALLLQDNPNTSCPAIHAIESDARKTAFMREVVRNCQIEVMIHTSRIEKIGAISADIITARALAPLDALLTYTRSFITSDTTCLFLKGATVNEEIKKVSRNWHMDIDLYDSISEHTGKIVKITKIREF